VGCGLHTCAHCVVVVGAAGAAPTWLKPWQCRSAIHFSLLWPPLPCGSAATNRAWYAQPFMHAAHRRTKVVARGAWSACYLPQPMLCMNTCHICLKHCQV
jgi:hypothetical protein